jgi:hypothetical protein
MKLLRDKSLSRGFIPFFRHPRAATLTFTNKRPCAMSGLQRIGSFLCRKVLLES